MKKMLTGRQSSRLSKNLPRDKQIMFVRRFYYCSTYREIADELNTTEDGVRMSLQRLREKLRKHLEKEGIGI